MGRPIFAEYVVVCRKSNYVNLELDINYVQWCTGSSIKR